MYIYRTLDGGGTPVASAEQARLKDDFRVIDVDGKPSSVVGIRFSPSAGGSQENEAHAEQPADPYEYNAEGNPQYWPDRPGAARKAWREEFKASLKLAAAHKQAGGHYKLAELARQNFSHVVRVDNHDFHNDVALQENKREAGKVWSLFKSDPLAPAATYWRQYGMPGMGLFLEGYVIFSITNNEVLFKQAYPKCWSKFTQCNKVWTEATQYLQLVGVLLGQFTFGILGDWIGRKATMLVDMSVIIIGLIMLTVSNGTTINGWVIMYAFAQLIFGFGIGGEYPMTSTCATEASEEDRQYGQRHRGRKVMLSYTMQGWGQFVNLGLLLLFLNIFNHHGNGPYGGGSAGATWRVSFAVLIPVAIYLLYYRVYVLKELKLLDQVKKKSGVTGYDWKSFRLLFSHFWHRLLGTSGIWFCNDWYFYGNGVFRSTIVELLVGSNASVQINWLYQFINAGCQLVGYYTGALAVDYRYIGRRKLTVFSFTMVALCYASVAGAYDRLTDPEHKKNLHVFQFLFYISSFFALAGSHTTSFLLSAELYPAPIRSTAHGISAASGKLGSILAVVWLNYLRSRNKFWITWPLAVFGAVVCYIFIADNTGLDLAEQERRWFFIRNGNASGYHGPAVHWRHLSRWERYVMKLHKQYDPVLDARQRHEAGKHNLTLKQEAEAVKDDSNDIVPSE